MQDPTSNRLVPFNAPGSIALDTMGLHLETFSLLPPPTLSMQGPDSIHIIRMSCYPFLPGLESHPFIVITMTEFQHCCAPVLYKLLKKLELIRFVLNFGSKCCLLLQQMPSHLKPAHIWTASPHDSISLRSPTGTWLQTGGNDQAVTVGRRSVNAAASPSIIPQGECNVRGAKGWLPNIIKFIKINGELVSLNDALKKNCEDLVDSNATNMFSSHVGTSISIKLKVQHHCQSILFCRLKQKQLPGQNESRDYKVRCATSLRFG